MLRPNQSQTIFDSQDAFLMIDLPEIEMPTRRDWIGRSAR